jgi:hypothetical protein
MKWHLSNLRLQRKEKEESESAHRNSQDTDTASSSCQSTILSPAAGAEATPGAIKLAGSRYTSSEESINVECDFLVEVSDVRRLCRVSKRLGGTRGTSGFRGSV